MTRFLCLNLRAAASLGTAAVATAVLALPASAAPSVPAKAAPAAATTPAPSPPKKADPAARAAADRLEPLARAAFWDHEVELDPTDVQAGVKLAGALRSLGRYDEAATAAQQVLVIKPQEVEALLELGRTRIAQGQSFYGVDPLEQAQRLAPNDWRPPSLLGVAYGEVKRDADSHVAFDRAITLSPDNPSVLSNMAMSLAAHGDAPGAETLLRRAALQPTATAKERQNLAIVLGYEGKLFEAEQLIRRDLPPEIADSNIAYLRSVAQAR